MDQQPKKRGAPLGNKRALGHKGYARTDLAGNQYAKKAYQRIAVSVPGEIVGLLAQHVTSLDEEEAMIEMKQFALFLIARGAADKRLFNEFLKTREIDGKTS